MPWAPRVVRTGRPSASSTVSTATPRRTVAPASVASTSRAGSSAERSKPTAGGPPFSVPYVRRTVAPPGVSRRIAGIGRATRAITGSGTPSRPSACDRDRRAEHAAGTPSPRRLSLQDGDVDAGARERGGKRAARQPAPDDRDVDQRGPRVRGRGHAGAPAGGPSTGATVAARATRYPIGPPTIDDSTRRPAAAIRDVSSATVYARRTDSGASRRV